MSQLWWAAAGRRLRVPGQRRWCRRATRSRPQPSRYRPASCIVSPTLSVVVVTGRWPFWSSPGVGAGRLIAWTGPNLVEPLKRLITPARRRLVARRAVSTQAHMLPAATYAARSAAASCRWIGGPCRLSAARRPSNPPPRGLHRSRPMPKCRRAGMTPSLPEGGLPPLSGSDEVVFVLTP